MKYPKREDLPKCCPFCLMQDVEWSEFKVKMIEETYYDAETETFTDRYTEDFEVFCTKCEEHIRTEDYINTKKCAICNEIIEGNARQQDDIDVCESCDEQVRGKHFE